MSDIETHDTPSHDAGHGHDDHGHHEQNWFMKYCWSTDHKMIAKQYLWTGMAMGFIGAFMAFVFRWQLAFPGSKVPFFD